MIWMRWATLILVILAMAPAGQVIGQTITDGDTIKRPPTDQPRHHTGPKTPHHLGDQPLGHPRPDGRAPWAGMANSRSPSMTRSHAFWPQPPHDCAALFGDLE